MKRSEELSIDIMPRDLLIFRGLFEARVMQMAHIRDLYFEGKEEAAKKRVQKLKANGLIRERKGRRVSESAILSLTSLAFELLTQSGQLALYPVIGWKSLEKRLDVSDLTLKHELTVLDVKAALAPALERVLGNSITEFTVWPRLCEFSVHRKFERKVVKPDGLLRVQETVTEEYDEEHIFFIEVDRGSESHDVLVEKAMDYVAYRRSGDLEKRLGISVAAPFRVLMIFCSPARKHTPSAERRNNVAERLLLSNEPFGKFICLTTFEEIIADPLGAIWVTPSAYRQATQGTDFDPERRREYRGPYVRRPERERFIDTNVVKQKLFVERKSDLDEGRSVPESG